MLGLRKILFPTDFSECAERAFMHAANIASSFNAEIHAFHARIRQKDEYPALRHLLDGLSSDEEQNKATEVTDTTFDLPDAGHDLIVHADATDTSACNAILKYAESHDIDLVVMGSHGRRGPKRLFLGSTAECVIRNASCPVLTLRSDADTMHGEKIAHILVPVDFSDYAEEALRYANEFALLWNARVTLVHAIEEAVIPTVYGIEPVAFTSIEPLLDKSKTSLENLASSFIDSSVEVDVHVLIGPPAAVISDYAKENGIDLIVLATHGLTGIKRFLLGSIAESLNRMAPSAVLTVKPFGKSLISKQKTRTEEVI